MQLSTASEANRPPPDSRFVALSTPLLGVSVLLIAWIGSYLPWIITKGAALSSNLYDLAEWTSLDPAVHGMTPPFLTPLLLRATSGLIAVALANRAAILRSRIAGWSLRVLALMIGVGLLPPFDFLRNSFGDPNYRQQFGVAVITVLAVLISGWRPSQSIRVGAAVLAVMCGVAGGILGLNAYRALGVHDAVGVGMVITVAALLASVVISAVQNRGLDRTGQASAV